jgi:hypothetical protein
MQHEELESQAAADLDAWITARLSGREELTSLPNLTPEVLELSALAQDLLLLAEEIQPDDEYVLDFVAGLKAASLRRVISEYHLSSFFDSPFLETKQVQDRCTDT